MNVDDLGWNDWFEAHRRKFCGRELKPARVIAVDRDRYIVGNDEGKFSALLTGKFLHSSELSADFPCVGDWVGIQTPGSQTHVTIHNVLPRKTWLRRKMPGSKIEFQMIGANIDTALVVQACHFDFNLRRLERYLVMVKEGGVEPLLILTKTDLIDADGLKSLIAEIRGLGVTADIVSLSSISGVGIDKVRERMVSGKTFCLVGSSGVGKSTLINRLLGRAELETKAVSGSGEGRHATVRRQLIVLDRGAILIDTPGMRELGMMGASDGIDDRYHDIAELAARCRFNDCTHSSEPGCAIVDALESGALEETHYGNYLKIRNESEFYEMSYLEKRKRDKEFGKMVNSILKHKRS